MNTTFTHTFRRSFPRGSSSSSSLQKTFIRHESSSRRTTKRLRLHPHPSMKLSADSPRTSHIVYNPPSSAPTPLITPRIFLPKDDPRRRLLAEVAPPKPEEQEGGKSELQPPPLRKPYEKTYHLTPADIEKIRELRAADPQKWSRAVLAREFNCSPLFVGIVAEASEARLTKTKHDLEKVKAGWGVKRAEAREDRRKRRKGWGGADGL